MSKTRNQLMVVCVEVWFASIKNADGTKGKWVDACFILNVKRKHLRQCKRRITKNGERYIYAVTYNFWEEHIRRKVMRDSVLKTNDFLEESLRTKK